MVHIHFRDPVSQSSNDRPGYYEKRRWMPIQQNSNLLIKPDTGVVWKRTVEERKKAGDLSFFPMPHLSRGHVWNSWRGFKTYYTDTTYVNTLAYHHRDGENHAQEGNLKPELELL